MAPVIDLAVNHPFNLEMKMGTLPREKFLYYVEQDKIFIEKFALCHKLIAERINENYKQLFLTHAHDCSQAAAGLFARSPDLVETQIISPMTSSYTDFLIKMCVSEPLELAIAAILPCFVLYQEVGASMIDMSEDNQYVNWMSSYTNASFERATNEMIELFDHFASATDDRMRKSMSDVFYDSAMQEIAFWSDAYVMGNQFVI